MLYFNVYSMFVLVFLEFDIGYWYYYYWIIVMIRLFLDICKYINVIMKYK